MLLKRLELLGFKSFADKVEIVFQPGITAVVGPNGCGKSNIADALRWALGEQSLKNLRGAKMDDIIFAGSDQRKPLGLAQVELVLDNSDGCLPLEFTEVSVARRLYRDGESEFLINKSYVRLRDIQELFLDTGLGKEAYSVIGQGKIDAILSAKAEERRAIFEEAAGVVKYKLRKAAAMRRLEETEVNLVRVMDLLAEIEGQLGPLHEQAVLAEQCQTLQEELARIDLNMTGRELAQLSEAIGASEGELAGIRERGGELEREETILEASLEETNLAALSSDEKIAREQQEVFTLGNRIEGERGRLELVRERVRTLDERGTVLAAQRSDLAARGADLEKRRTEQAAALAEVSAAREELLASLADSEDSISHREDAVQSLIRREDELKVEIIEDMNNVAAARNELHSIQMEQDYQTRASREMEAKAGALATETERLEAILSAAEQVRTNLAAAEKETAQAEGDLAERRRKLQSSLAGLDAKNQDWRERIKGIESKLAVLEEMERTYQGYFPGVRSILVEAKNEPFAPGIRGLVAELISVRPGYEVALEVALGSALQHVVIEDDLQAQAAVAFLKRTGRGRATFLPLNMVRGHRANAPGLAEAMAECGAHHATDLLDFDPVYRGIIDQLMGNTLVATDLAGAVTLAKRTNKSFRIVTKEGEIISVGGAITGGAIDQRKMQILGRKREIEELRTEKDTSLSFLAKGSAEAQKARLDLERLEAEQAELAEKRRELAQGLATAGLTVENHRVERARQDEETEVLRLQLAENEKRAGDLTGRLAAARDRLALAEETLAAHRSEMETLGDELRRRQNEKDAALQALNDFRVSLAAKSEEEKRYREAFSQAEKSVSQLAADLDAAEREAREIEAGIAAQREEETRIAGALDQLAMARSEAESVLAAAIAEREEAQGNRKKTETRLRALRRERNVLGEQGHRLELHLGEWRVRVENHQAHLVQEYGFDWEEHLDPAWQMEREQAADRLESLRSEIRGLGPVNMGAIAEYEGLKNRHDFLRRQSDDLAGAKESLLKIIEEVERTIGKRFLETFGAVREAFSKLFKKLFAGGNADLLLIDPDNPLESGIEVVAQPPGKRLQSLALLSGGERAMTAIALLFSILEIKPSPFCILDEIDATLDEANVARFADLLVAFSQRTQLIVITHRRGTMEAADALYGVTMEELGVSKLISVELKEKAG